MVIGTDCTENRVDYFQLFFFIGLKERTETLPDICQTFTAKSSTTEVILCHREVKSAIIKAGKELKKRLETFIIENKFYYNDRFLQQNSINII